MPCPGGCPSPHRRVALLAAVLALLVIVSPVHAVVPDALQQEQWAVAPGAILDLPPAWELSEGAGVTVAVIDSGTDLDHPDLAPNIWTNTGEIAGNRRDDDGNGYVDDVNGVDLTTQTDDNVPDDQDGHGTHVAGIVAGARDGRGIVGVAFKAKIMSIKVLDKDGLGTTEAVAAGIRYATANGARIINLSLNGPTPSKALSAAVDAACAAQVLIVASAGNGGTNIDTTASYPVSIPSPCMIGVAATSAAGGGQELGSNSNYGRYTIALAAPGVGVLSTALGGGYELRTGTSMAAPHVTGVAALAAAVNPGLSAPDLRGRIMGAARPASIPVIAGYLVASDAVRAAPGAVSPTLGQPPALSAINVQVSGERGRRWLQAQVTVGGSSAAVRRYDVRARGRRIAVVHSRRPTFVVRIRVQRAPRRITVVARDGYGKALAILQAQVGVLREGKPYLGRARSLKPASGNLWRPAGARMPRAKTVARAAATSSGRLISISGSATAGALVADLIYYYRRGRKDAPRFTLIHGSTAIGIADALRGVVSIGLAARDRRSGDPAATRFTPMARSAVCIATNRRNRVANLTGDQLRDLVAGKLTTWPQVAGSGLPDPISVLAEPPFEGTQDVFDDAFLTPELPRIYQPRYLPSSALVRRAIARSTAAIGWIDIAYTAGLNVLRIDGVPCTRAAVAAARYPARRSLSFVTRGRPRGAVAKFIRWVRTSGVARRAVGERYVPLR